jgi:PEP-CTERM motif
MRRRLAAAVLLISVCGLLAAPASAQITSVSAAGPGGTVSSLAIGSTFFGTDDSIQFDANYTSPAPIVFTLTVDGSGDYFIGVPFGDITNGTGGSFPSFFAFLMGAPAGVAFDGAGWDPAVFSSGTNFPPSTSEVALNGPPGLGAGNSTGIEVFVSVPSSGLETFEVVLTPVAVPEPSTWAMLALGFAGLAFTARRRPVASV